MKTGNRTTYILLERGTEDMKLLKELNSITAATGIPSSIEFARKYPCIVELRQGLEDEREEE